MQSKNTSSVVVDYWKISRALCCSAVDSMSVPCIACVVLCLVVLCCVVLCYVGLCCIWFCCVVLCWVVLCVAGEGWGLVGSTEPGLIRHARIEFPPAQQNTNTNKNTNKSDMPESSSHQHQSS